MPHCHRPVNYLRLWGILCVFFLCFSHTCVAQMNRSQVILEAEERTGGKVLSVKPVDESRYRVRVIMPDGRIKNLVVDTDNGKGKPKGKKS